jgi:Tol biopolymer transport system component
MARTFWLALTFLLALPAVAQATLVFDRDPVKPAVWVASDDGSGARKLAAGNGPRIAPDGRTVVFARSADTGTGYRSDLMAVPADGSAAPRTLAKGWRDAFTFAWSPDSRTVATVTGPEVGTGTLELIDVASGGRHAVARGYFGGASFAPDGAALLYSRYPHATFPPASDVWRIAVADGARGGVPVRITRDRRSENPLWGPADRVVLVKLVDGKRRRYGPKSELYVMNPDGTGTRRLTTTKVDPLLFGLGPLDFSADGTRLLTEFGGQDTSYAVTVDPSTGRQRTVLRAEERGFVGARLSADGTTILGATGGYDPEGRHDVVTVPYAGGAPTLLARNASDPDWTR